ncbi:SDR family NAD(P)-dependent oxidoreductase [Acidovorax facilis]|jgi:NAD(P)-dependent dehydrogenase (short-subunit alcohol dehydrogenase family)|uniref:SDR family NAD(P)-dependent oxidoreductase n=1 Tax=Acidovorax facilis TaxID=12917 RepID=UPI003D65D319
MYGYKKGVAVVTGAANGIGRAIALRLADEGCAVSLWDVDGAGLEAVAAQCRSAGVAVDTRVVDVGALPAVREAAAATTAVLGEAPRILVNAAGIGQVASILDGSPEEFDETMRVNVRGTYNCCHVLLPAMTAQRGGNVVNIASWFGKSGRPMSLAYCASKFALIGMTQSMALDLARDGIRVNAVCPGTITDTRMREAADRQAVAKGLPPATERVHMIPLARLGTPGDVANVVAFLISEQASYMTGQSINVTGGLWMN